MRNLKKVIALVAVFAMMVSTVAFAQTFGDVADGDNYYEAIETLNKLGVLTGDDNDNNGVMEFRPADSITRAEITVIVARIKGQTGAVAQSNTVFTDVPSSHWASGYIANATNQGVVNGYGDGTFGPDDKVLYQDVVKMLMETLGYKPYAAENGGYPTGYLLAAQQQNVLKGVIGATEGLEATRGQVAQMTYNAIDTPLMDRYVYGNGQGQYVVWDGESWSPRKTLMNQYLGIQKLRGVVMANNVTELTAVGSIDTSVNQKIRLYIEDNYLGSNDTSITDYELYDTVDLYTGDTNANDYLGYDVVVYAKDNKNDTDTLLSITEATGRNTKQSFTLAQYDSLDLSGSNSYICYMKNDTDRSATKIKLQEGTEYDSASPAVILNGRYLGSGIDALQDVFNDTTIYKDSAYSGEVVTLDNDTTNGVDVVFVNVAAGAVVDEVNARGTVTFKNDPASIRTAGASTRFNKIDFNSSDSNVIVNITKDGQAYDYTQLKAWDVLSVIARTDNGEEYYDVEVLGADTAVVGSVSRTTVSETSETGKSYTIDGNDYDVASGAYNTGSLKAGTAGTFYVDKFGKIVAYNKTAVNGSTNVTGDNYGYVLNAAENNTSFNEAVPQLQILYKDGTIGVWDFASTVSVDNPTADVAAFDEEADADTATIKYKDVDSKEDLAKAFVGQVITFNGQSGQIKNITMAITDKGSDDYETSLALTAQSDNSDYDEEIQQFKIGSAKIDVDEETLIFYIGKTGDTFGYLEAAESADIDNCKIGSGAALRQQSGKSVVAYSNGDDTNVADVLVIYNSNPGLSPSAPVAYVTSIGSTTVDGTRVLSVRYYENGEIKEAVTDSTVVGDLSIDTVEGSAFKFTMAADGTTITDATPYITFDGTVRDKLTAGDDLTTAAGVPNVKKIAVGDDDEDVYFGAVIKKQNGRLTIATTSANAVVDPADIQTISLNNVDATYYTYDPSRSASARFGVGSMGDITVDKTLTADALTDDAPKTISIAFNNGTAEGVAPAWGMLDYVFVRMYEKTADVIDYMAWEYDYNIQ